MNLQKSSSKHEFEVGNAYARTRTHPKEHVDKAL